MDFLKNTDIIMILLLSNLSVKCSYLIGLLTGQKRLPLCPPRPPHPIAPRNPLKGIRTCVLRPCHDEMREEVFGCSDGNKKHLLFVVKTTNGFFFFLMMAMKSVCLKSPGMWQLRNASVECQAFK